MELTSLTLAEAAGQIARREISPVELTQAYLDRIEALNPSLNCFITVTADLALEQARKAEAEIMAGQYRGSLHGIPLALKDLYETKGVRTTAGSKFFENYIPEQDAPVVEKLYAAGALLLGKLNMHEIALGVTTVNPHYGPARNPWDLQCAAGGSSGGSAAALAASLCLGSLGSDTGGSIRIPSSLCGIVGLKPTYGRTSLRGVIPLSWNLDHAGPMGVSVRDVAILLQCIAGYDLVDPASIDVPVDDYLGELEQGVRGWRVALIRDDFFNKADIEVLAAVQTAAKIFQSQGAIVSETSLPGGRQAAQANGQMVVSDAAAFHSERLQSNPGDFGADVLQRLRSGQETSLADYILARRAQVECRRQFERFFEQYDILLVPTTPIAAPKIEGDDAVERARQLTRFTAPFNLTGLPALSLPCGFTHQGLPVGLQIVSRPWAEAQVLRAGFAYERATEWHRLRPDLKRNQT